MFFEDIDWEQIWIETLKNNPHEKESQSSVDQWVKRWDDIAEKFSERNMLQGSFENECYVKSMLSRIEVNKDSTILDIGSGPGTLSIPLAKRAGHVTAIDMSKKMVELLENNVAKEHINNITVLNKNWEEVQLGKDLEKHDVVIASRSVGGFNLKNSLLKIIDATEEKAYISCLAKGNDFDRYVYERVGKKYHFSPTHILIYNLLYQLGYYADIDIFTCEGGIIHKNFDEAYSYFKWHMQDLNKKEEEMLNRALLELFGTQTPNRHLPKSKWDWALISWSKKVDVIQH